MFRKGPPPSPQTPRPTPSKESSLAQASRLCRKPSAMPKPKVLFICLGNSCRSIMAEALARHRCGDRWDAASAGINPLGFVAPETLTVLTEIGVSLAGLYSKGLEKFRPYGSIAFDQPIRPFSARAHPTGSHRQGAPPAGAGPLRMRSGYVPPEPGRYPSGDHPGTLPGGRARALMGRNSYCLRSHPTSRRGKGKGMRWSQARSSMFAAGCAGRTTGTGKQRTWGPYMRDG